MFSKGVIVFGKELKLLTTTQIDLALPNGTMSLIEIYDKAERDQTAHMYKLILIYTPCKLNAWPKTAWWGGVNNYLGPQWPLVGHFNPFPNDKILDSCKNERVCNFKFDKRPAWVAQW